MSGFYNLANDIGQTKVWKRIKDKLSRNQRSPDSADPVLCAVAEPGGDPECEERVDRASPENIYNTATFYFRRASSTSHMSLANLVPAEAESDEEE